MSELLVLPHALKLSQLLHLLSLERLSLAVSNRGRFFVVLSLFPLPDNSFLLDLAFEFFQRFFKRLIIVYHNERYGESPPFIVVFELLKGTSESHSMSRTPL